MRSRSPAPAEGDANCYWWRSLPEVLEESGRMTVLKEMERVALLGGGGESLDHLRHRLTTYKAGDLWFPAGGITKEETDIPPVITILLLGFAGTGKTSLINLMYSVLGRSGFIPFAQTSSSSSTLPAGKGGQTLYLEEHNVLRSIRSGFCIFDSRGLDYSQLQQGLDEVSEWMEDGVRHRQLCRGSGIASSSSSPSSPCSYSPSSSSSSSTAKMFARRRVNCAVVVASLSELYQSMVAGDFRPLEATRELFHAPSIKTYCNENPILILTHGDELTAEERLEGRVRLCEYLGTSETAGVYDIVCLNEHGSLVDEMDPVTAYSLSEAIYRALFIADRGHPPKPSVKDWLILMLAWAMCSLAALFAFMSQFCSKLAKATSSRDCKM